MKIGMIYAVLFSAVIYVFCFTSQACAYQTGITSGPSDEYGPQAGAGGSRQTELLDSPGGILDGPSGLRSRGSAVNAPAVERARLEGIGPDMFKVLSVIRRRTNNPKLLNKVKYKLSTMSENRLRLAVSLSERASDGGGIRTDIAFFLLSTLIVFT
jgi:hypothetical protein